jgi:hypothetical protein
VKVFFCVVIIIIAVAIVAAGSGDHKYVGVSKCELCHKLKIYGDQYGIWEKGPHAKAFVVLGSEEAKKIAQERNIKDPQKSSECLPCHVTAYGVADSLKEDSYTMEAGIGCETCHGPGSDYMKMTVMKDREKAIAAGLIIPDKNTCLACHNQKSPTFKPFNYEERVKAIAHPLPKKGNGY